MEGDKVIGACGFSATGSSAVVDYLHEFDENVVASDFEFTISHMPDGLQDLRYHLFEGCIKHTSGCLALDRFQRATTGYPCRMLNQYTHGKLPEYASAFLDEITQCTWIGTGTPDPFYHVTRSRVSRVLLKFKLAKFYRALETRAGKDLALYPYSEKRFACRPENYDEAARRLVSALLAELGRVPGKNIVLDQPFAGNDPVPAFRYFDNPLAVIVDRDPRDYYLLAKVFYYPKGWRLVPCEDVRSFVTYFRALREGMPYLVDDPRVLRIRFEDLIYEYDETTKRLEDFCGLKDHVSPKKYLDPAKSIHNTNLQCVYPQYESDIKYIERELPEYLYPFERYEDKAIKGKRNFFIRS